MTQKHAKHAYVSKSLHQKHVEKVAKKKEAIQGKEALLAIWEKHNGDDRDHDYMLKLRARIRNLKTQFAAMRPIEDEEEDF